MKRTLLLLGVWGSLSGALRAQTPAEIATLEHLRDSVGTLPDEALRSAAGSAETPKDPLDRVRYGILFASAGDRFGSIPLLTQAADQFYEVTVRRPKWVYGWYGLGATKAILARLNAREVRSPHQSAGTGWAWGGSQALIHALTLDSSYTPAAAALARLAPRLTVPSQLEDAARSMRTALTADSTDPQLWMMTARSARAQGQDVRALDAFRRAEALPEVPAGEAHLEIARELFALGQNDEARREYLTGAAAPDSAGRAMYRQDLAYIADSLELARWDSLPRDGRPAWLVEFWGGRERASGRPSGSRLIEHNRRRRYALLHYSTIPAWARQYDFGMIYRSSAEEIDDRGAVYMRHGEPDATASTIGGMFPSLWPNESWLYYRPEGNLLFHFMAGTRTGWHLVTSLSDIVGGGVSAELYYSRMGLDGSYGIIGSQMLQDSLVEASLNKVSGLRGGVSSGHLGRAPMIAMRIERERRERTTEIRRGLSTDSDPIRFEREMEPIVQVFGAGGTAPGTGRLVVAISLPANDRLVPVPLPDGGTGYLLRLRITSADGAGHTTLDQDSLIKLRTPRPLARGEHLSLVRTFDLPATGEQRVRLILTDTARAYGAVRVVNDVPLPDLGVAHPQMSDLIVGKEGSGVEWHRPEGGIVPLHPLNSWQTTDAIEISFEVAGLTLGTAYKVRIGLADLGADSTAPPRASVEFENQVSGARELLSQSLSLRGVRPGKYLLTATITAGTTVIRRERRIAVMRPQ